MHWGPAMFKTLWEVSVGFLLWFSGSQPSPYNPEHIWVPGLYCTKDTEQLTEPPVSRWSCHIVTSKNVLIDSYKVGVVGSGNHYNEADYPQRRRKGYGRISLSFSICDLRKRWGRSGLSLLSAWKLPKIWPCSSSSTSTLSRHRTGLLTSHSWLIGRGRSMESSGHIWKEQIGHTGHWDSKNCRN